MKINEMNVRPVTLPPNQMTSPYAYCSVRQIIKHRTLLRAYDEYDCKVFKNCIHRNAEKLLRYINEEDKVGGDTRRTRLLDPVYITITSMKLIGNQAFASCMSKALNEMIPAFFTIATQLTHTRLCMQSYKDGTRVMESQKSRVCVPPTKNSWKSLRQKLQTGAVY
jgi:hypothetical protein